MYFDGALVFETSLSTAYPPALGIKYADRRAEACRLRGQALTLGLAVPHVLASEGFLLEAPSTGRLETELQCADGPSLEPLPKRLGALRSREPLQHVAWAKEVIHFPP